MSSYLLLDNKKRIPLSGRLCYSMSLLILFLHFFTFLISKFYFYALSSFILLFCLSLFLCGCSCSYSKKVLIFVFLNNRRSILNRLVLLIEFKLSFYKIFAFNLIFASKVINTKIAAAQKAAAFRFSFIPPHAQRFSICNF